MYQYPVVSQDKNVTPLYHHINNALVCAMCIVNNTTKLKDIF